MSKKNKKKSLKDNIENEVLKEQIDKIAHDSVTNLISFYQKIIYSFFLGISVFILTGFLTKGQLFEIIAKNIYKPTHIYTDIKPILKKEIWNEVSSGSEEDYCKFVSRDEFYNALKKYHTDLVRSFLVPNRDPIVRANEILRVGTVKQEVHILMGGNHIEGRVTARCYKKFHNSSKQAIIVIPTSYERSDYSWYDCSFGWPTIFLTLEYEGKICDNIQLVGVRRNGKTSQLTILISKKVAERIDIPGWNNYKSNGYGRIYVSRVNDITIEQYHNETYNVNDDIVTEKNRLPTNNINKRKLTTTNKIDDALRIFHDSNFNKSYKKFNKILASGLEEGKERSFVLFMMGECLFNSGEYDLAILDYQKVISNYPKSKYASKALLKQGLSFQKLTDSETAKIIFKKIITTYPTTPEANKAKKLIDNKIINELDDKFTKNKLANTSDINDAMTLYSNNKFKESYQLFDILSKTISEDKKRIFVLYMMGECLFNSGEYDLAILDYQRLISNHPKSEYIPKALLKQGLSFQKLTDHETAKIIFKKIITAYPTTPEASKAQKLLFH